MIIYHNPRCSKSRQALGILRDNAEEPDVVDYLKEPLGQAELGGLLKKLGVQAHDLLRPKEDEYDELGRLAGHAGGGHPHRHRGAPNFA